ncbi:MAG: hypothetical protein R3A52_26895 [Polyangiales bacterium]
MRRWMLAALVCAGCASGAGSRSENALRRMMEGPVARAAARDAPQAYAEAARAAERARGLSGQARADAVAEVALLLEWAQAEGRTAAARRRRDEAERAATAAESEADRVEAQSTEVARMAEAQRAARAADQRAQRAVASPTSVNEAERAATAAEVRQSAVLLMAAARMLGADDAALATATRRMTESEREGLTPTQQLTTAGAAYTAAEEALRTFRASRPTPANATRGADLSTALSQAGGLDPHRDERGVVLVLRGLFTGATLSPASRARVETLSRVLRTHADARVRVEAFAGGPARAAAEARARAQADALATALAGAGVARERIQSAGVYRLPNGQRGDDRVEVVLVLPGEP